MFNFLVYLDIIQINKYIKNLKLFLILFYLLIFLQIILGAFLSGMDGGLIYNSWPL